MDTKETIMHHALLLWGNRGYSGVGIQEICNAADITKPTLYHHFQSKAGLLDKILESIMEPWCLMVCGCCTYHHDITHNLNELARQWCARVTASRPEARLFLVLGTAGQNSEEGMAMEPWIENIQTSVRNLFAEAAQDHGNMKGRETRYAASFLGILEGYTKLHIRENLPLDDSLVYPMVHQFMHGIFS